MGEPSIQRDPGTKLDERRQDGTGQRETFYGTEQARGNVAPKPAAAPEPHLKRVVTSDDGTPIVVEEESGVAWAEGVSPAVHSVSPTLAHETGVPAPAEQRRDDAVPDVPTPQATAAGGAMPLSARLTAKPLPPLAWVIGGAVTAMAARAFAKRRDRRT